MAKSRRGRKAGACAEGTARKEVAEGKWGRPVAGTTMSIRLDVLHMLRSSGERRQKDPRSVCQENELAQQELAVICR